MAVQATETKFRRSTGVTTANSTNKDPNTNKLSWVINYLLLGLLDTILEDEVVLAQVLVVELADDLD